MDPSSFTKTSFCNIQIDNITTNESKQFKILNQLSILCYLTLNIIQDMRKYLMINLYKILKINIYLCLKVVVSLSTIYEQN